MNINIYEEKYKILSKDTEASEIMKISAMFDCLHNIADHSLISSNLDKASLEKHGILWVLGEQSAEIYELPKLGDEITIKTWVGKEMFDFIPRFYKVLKSGKEIIKASSVWALIDKESRDTISPKDCHVSIEHCITGDEISVLKAPKKLEINSTYTAIVSSENLDLNNHMNNAQYFEVIDKFNPLIQNGGLIQPKKIIARYSKEALLDDELSIKEGLQDSSRFYTVDSPKGNHLKLRIEY